MVSRRVRQSAARMRTGWVSGAQLMRGCVARARRGRERKEKKGKKEKKEKKEKKSSIVAPAEASDVEEGREGRFGKMHGFVAGGEVLGMRCELNVSHANVLDNQNTLGR